MKFVPLHGRNAIRRNEVDEKTDGGLYMKESDVMGVLNKTPYDFEEIDTPIPSGEV